MKEDKFDKASVRALAAVSGVSYQQCLAAIQVLFPLSDRMDLGELTPIVRNERGPRVIGLSADGHDLIALHRLFAKYRPSGDAYALNRVFNETRLLITINALGAEMIYDLALAGRLWPPRPWKLDAAELSAAVRTATASSSDRSQSVVLVHAEPAQPTFVPPDETEETAPALEQLPPRLLEVGRALVPNDAPESMRAIAGFTNADDHHASWVGLELPDGAQLWTAIGA